jgi:hypothetical protein
MIISNEDLNKNIMKTLENSKIEDLKKLRAQEIKFEDDQAEKQFFIHRPSDKNLAKTHKHIEK